MMRPFLAAFASAMIFSTGELSAQTNGGTSTKDGVYTREQAIRGQDVYAGNCKSCHTPESHTGPVFTSKWNDKPLLSLYAYVRDLMPKNDPGTLSAEENADVLAYILRLNKLPMGDVDLPADTAALKRIRFQVGGVKPSREKENGRMRE
jgi:mono/diheme cytochrome c family protein